MSGEKRERERGGGRSEQEEKGKKEREFLKERESSSLPDLHHSEMISYGERFQVNIHTLPHDHS